MAGEHKGKFSGNIGYVLAVAGSAVGLGNIWRFPYLAAKYGGGAFILTYLIFVITLGFTFIVAETALGRKTGASPVGAFSRFIPADGKKKGFFKTGGWLNAVVPMIILPYYSVIGGWVLKFLVDYCTGHTGAMAQDGYFGSFLGNTVEMELWYVFFALMVLGIISLGVKHGVESMSKIMMPLLILLAIIVAVFSVTRPGAMDGVKYLFIPRGEGFSIMTVVAAMGQMFYSLSIAMGILMTYGSYLGKDVDIERSSLQVGICDTGVAILASLIVVPAVFAFSGGDMETLQAGPSLMFIMIPKIFASMKLGTLVGIAFFLMVMFAALTSAISLLETSVATLCEELGWKRKYSILFMALEMLIVGSLCAAGYGGLSWIRFFGGRMDILDTLDFITNSVMLPINAFFTCILINRYVTRDGLAHEVTLSSKFRARKMWDFMLKWVCPICMVVVLGSSIANAFGWIKI